jgi:hypothetical protein
MHKIKKNISTKTSNIKYPFWFEKMFNYLHISGILVQAELLWQNNKGLKF